MLSFAPPAVSTPAGTTHVTLSAASIDRIGAEAAWVAVRAQATQRVTVADGCSFSFPYYETRVRPVVGRDGPGMLVRMVDSDPEMVRRIAWTPGEARVAQGLLDRAVADSLGGPRVAMWEIRFWTDGRLLTLMNDAGHNHVPRAALGWLGTGDWDSPAPDPDPVLTVGTFPEGGQIRRNADGRTHADDGPAFIGENGGHHWYRHGRRHREGGPALCRPDGTRQWWTDGQRHC